MHSLPMPDPLYPALPSSPVFASGLGMPVADGAWRCSSAGPVREPASPDVDVLVEEEEEEDTSVGLDEPWKVILYNDDVHTFEEVIAQLIKATGCSTEKAERHAWTVHTRGKDAVYEGGFEDCFRVQGVLREIQLVTEIEG